MNNITPKTIAITLSADEIVFAFFGAFSPGEIYEQIFRAKTFVHNIEKYLFENLWGIVWKIPTASQSRILLKYFKSTSRTKQKSTFSH